MKFEKQKMVGWFDFEQLIDTGLKTVISTTLGNYADRREIQAALSPGTDFYDLSTTFEDDIWIDFVADLGDGFNSTYTVAHLLGKMALNIGELHLPQGKVLLMGGDCVYPTPEMLEYNNRLKGPYKAAFPDPDDENYWESNAENPKKRVKKKSKELTPPIQRPPFLFAIPGNHDWYDGLSNFIKIFTQERRFGNWQTLQKRSYFAIKLKNDFWIWGTDVQLDSDIDQPQKEYFQHIGKQMADNSKIIMCTAEPAWVFRSMSSKNTSYDRLKYFEKNYIENENGWLGPDKKHQLVATLTGDLHHFAHYFEEGNAKQLAKHRFTAGGGGAFLHPTHNLPETLKDLTGEELSLKNCYPSKEVSKNLLLQNFIFPFINLQFVGFMAVLYLLFAWLLWMTRVDNAQLGIFSDDEGASFLTWLSVSFHAIPSTPFILVIAAIFLAFYYFTDRGSSNNKLIWILGMFHALTHISGLFGLIWWLTQFNLRLGYETIWVLSGRLVIGLLLCGGFLGATIMGIYLYISNRFFNIHLTESFSGLAIEDYKHFLKIHIEKEKITVYPIGIDKITRDWKNFNTTAFPMFRGTKPVAHLIGGKPVVIQNFAKKAL